MKRKLQLLGLFAVLMLTALSQLSAQVITMTTTENVGETIELAIVGEGDITIDGVKEDWQPSSSWVDKKGYTLTSQTVKIRGKVTKLTCIYERLSRLDVSGCTALEELLCGSSELSRLDVSGCTALTSLNCSSNQLSRLDVSGCTALTSLWCSSNRLSRLDVSDCRALTNLLCSSNRLSRLDVSKNTGLDSLECSSNQLSSLDVSKNTALTYLYCSDNELSRLDVSGCRALTYLYCSDNELSRLDVSKNTALVSLYCSDNELSSLDVSKNTALERLYCYNNLLTELKGCTSKKLRDILCYRNRINATAMWRIINDLNDEGGDKRFNVLEDKDGNGEANLLTKKQIYKAKLKGWQLGYKSKGEGVKANADEVSEPTAIGGLDGAEAFACYPNPATDFVSLKGLEPQAEVKVYSMAGACVLRVKADASGLLDLDVRHLSEGLYLVKAGSRTMKLEVKH